jgi:enoyl-CoA hydratase/carnithine racemase
MSDILLSETHGRVLRLVLNRTERRNALNAQLCRELVDAVHHANHDPRYGCVVLCANGPSFCAGMDLQEVGHVDPDNLGHLHDQLFTMGTRLSKPLIAAVDGPALAGGFGLLANCHVVVASPRSTFGVTEIRVGLWPFLIQRAAVNAIGERRFMELALTGRIFGADEAMDMSLIQVVDEDPNRKAMEIGENLASASLPALRSGLNYTQEIRGEDWEMAGMLGRNARDELMQGVDFQEGLRAFREKRHPSWPSLAQKQGSHGGEPL